jgi:hypothetical protein
MRRGIPSFVLACALTAGTASFANAATVVVHASDLATGSPCFAPSCTYALSNPVWFFYNDETDFLDNTLGSFVLGPPTAPAGRGSAQISVSGTQRRNLATYQFSGTPLSTITTLRYTTYNPSAGNGGSPNRSGYLQFNVDFNGSDTFQRRLLFLPIDNGAVTQNTWKEWDALNGGSALWRYSGASWPAPNAQPGSTPKTWNQILADYPGVRIRVTDSWLGIRVGEPYADGYTENIDSFKFGTGAGNTTFDFEPGPYNVVTPGTAPTCITPANPCVTIPVAINRTDAIGLRGFSVQIQLSPNLQLCSGTASVTEGTYLNSVSATDYHVVDLGGGLYRVDDVILGLPCGATAASGTLFNVAVKKAPGPDGIGTVSIAAVTLRDCSNAPVLGDPGAPASFTIDTAPPSTVSLSAVQKLTGNLPSGSSTTDVTLSFGAPEAGASVAIYRKGFGGYPQYDENGGVVPSQPATPAAAAGSGWTLTSVTSSPGNDRTATRDFYYFVAFVTDACGNVSGPSTVTGGTLNYHLGDVHNGVTNCVGNDLVNTSDISFLGTNYGVIIPVNGALECLDVGPTTNNSVSARPTTDNRTDFEDLILFAINYGQVSVPQGIVAGSPLAMQVVNRLSLDPLAKMPAVGETFAAVLRLQSAGDIQGLSAQLDYDARVVEPVGVEAGEMLGQQSAQGIVLSSKPGNVDVAVLGTGATIAGDGKLAQVRFRVKSQGAPAITIRAADARDTENQRVALDGMTAGAPNPGAAQATGLAMSRPSPFRESTTLEYTLARAGSAQLSIYSVDGRRIRTLVSGSSAPGTFRIGWDGRDDASHAVPAGMYYARFVTDEGRFTRTLVRVR